MYYIIAVIIVAVLIIGYFVYRNNQVKVKAHTANPAVAKVKEDSVAAKAKAKVKTVIKRGKKYASK